jgi:hypothetical protein
MNHTTGLARDEVIDLCVLINSTEREPGALKWPPILGLFKCKYSEVPWRHADGRRRSL